MTWFDWESVLVDAIWPNPLGLDLADGAPDYSKFVNADPSGQWSFLVVWWPNVPTLGRDAWPNEDSLLGVVEWHWLVDDGVGRQKWPHEPRAFSCHWTLQYFQ